MNKHVRASCTAFKPEKNCLQLKKAEIKLLGELETGQLTLGITPRPTPTKTLNWTRDAYYCHKIGKNCHRCPIFNLYDITNCKIYKTVDILLKKQIPIPQFLLKKPRRKKEEGYEYAVRGTLCINSTTEFIPD